MGCRGSNPGLPHARHVSSPLCYGSDLDLSLLDYPQHRARHHPHSCSKTFFWSELSGVSLAGTMGPWSPSSMASPRATDFCSFHS